MNDARCVHGCTTTVSEVRERPTSIHAGRSIAGVDRIAHGTWCFVNRINFGCASYLAIAHSLKCAHAKPRHAMSRMMLRRIDSGFSMTGFWISEGLTQT